MSIDNAPTREPDRSAVPSRNPLPLSASQEAQVREVFYARVRRHCAPEIKAFAECAVGRTFTLAFACRETRHAMNGCMKAWATRDEEDAAREEWFAGRVERQRERERKTRRKLEQEAFVREWWGLPGEELEAKRREEEERMRMAERVGGQPSLARRRGGGVGAGEAEKSNQRSIPADREGVGLRPGTERR